MMLHCRVLTSGECIGTTVFDYLDMSLLIQYRAQLLFDFPCIKTTARELVWRESHYTV